MHATRAPYRHPIADSDQRFFDTNPRRKLLVRWYVKGEFDVDRFLTFFDDDGNGRLREVNTVIVRQVYPGCRTKIALHDHGANIANTDAAISAFLIGRGINPATLKRAGK
jgi:hypothetical protein